ncbi:MAG: hypothetical protein LBK58_04950 [Prevotellaceae bacterium]|jgi:hypothetical protein|nr:hypothetical protein [Prevotellaceae bacterium]
MIKKLLITRTALEKKVRNINQAIRLLDGICNPCDDMDRQLSTVRTLFEEQIGNIDETLRHLRETCEHDWVPAGNDSHYDYEKCTRCEERRRV